MTDSGGRYMLGVDVGGTLVSMEWLGTEVKSHPSRVASSSFRSPSNSQKGTPRVFTIDQNSSLSNLPVPNCSANAAAVTKRHIMDRK